MRTRSLLRSMSPAGGRDDLRRQLLAQVRGLSFPAFAECVRHTLQACGYTGVETRRTSSKGKNVGGGWDLEAALNAGFSSGRTLIQLRHSPKLESVQCRCVDELRGAALRAGASEGLLVTSSVFSPVAVRAASSCSHPPVMLIDGERLADLMRRHFVGLRRDASECNDPDRWILDGAYFDTLGRNELPNSPVKAIRGIRVTITVLPEERSSDPFR